MVTSVRASLDAERQHRRLGLPVWTDTHSTRPGGAGTSLAARHPPTPITPPAPEADPAADGAGNRNAMPLYRIANSPHRPPLHAGHGAAGLGAARARRLRQCVRDRELHGRAGEGRRHRSDRIPPTHLKIRAPATSSSAQPSNSAGARRRSSRRAAAAASRSRGTRTWQLALPSRSSSRSSTRPAACG